MWFMPSYGRPERLRELLAAPGGWPDEVVVLVNPDDPCPSTTGLFYGQLEAPPWHIVYVPVGSRCADAHRYITTVFPSEPFYGLLCDDQWPVTTGWWQAMEKAVEDRYVVVPNGEPNFPLCRTAVALGGRLVNAMGSLVPAPLKHNFEDNIWDDIAREHGLLRPLPDYVVEHRHHIRGTAPLDDTYRRGSADFALDQSIYEQWVSSDDKRAMDARIKALCSA